MKQAEKRLEGLARFEVLNETEMNILTGGLLAEASNTSDKKDVDSTSQDSYRDDKSQIIVDAPF